MRFSRLFVLVGTAVALGACHGDALTNVTPPPLAGVRYINAVPDTFDVDIRPVDQVQWTATANRLRFRSGTEHMPMEAKARHIRVFTQPGDAPDPMHPAPTPDIVSNVLVDTTITFEANTNYTLLLTGSARAKTVKFVVLKDAPAADEAKVQYRAVNASGAGAIDAYMTRKAGDPLPGSPSFAGVASNVATAYLTQTADTVAARAFATGTTTPALAQQAGPVAPKTDPGMRPAAGVTAPGSAFSVVYFPASVAGSPALQFANPGIVYFVDRNPGATQGVK